MTPLYSTGALGTERGNGGQKFPADAGTGRVDGAGEASAIFLEKGTGTQWLAGDGGNELVACPCHLFVFQQPQDIVAPLGSPAGDIFLQSVHAEVDLAAARVDEHVEMSSNMSRRKTLTRGLAL